MKKSNVIWGVVCLVLAAVLEILNLTLPPDSMIFYAGEQNMRWVPAVVLAITGIVLLATARKPAEPANLPEQAKPIQDPEKAAQNKHLESIAWGLFLVMLGGFALVPKEMIAKGVWPIGLA